MEKIYYNLIIHGKKTLEQVPEHLREKVEELLRKGGYLTYLEN